MAPKVLSAFAELMGKKAFTEFGSTSGNRPFTKEHCAGLNHEPNDI
jgi:hypothetical protein